MDAVILSIGDELTSGQTANTNAAWLSRELASVGIGTSATSRSATHCCPLSPRSAKQSRRGTALLLISGGLGPTEDDLTRQALADALGEALVEDPSAVMQIEQWFKSKGRPMSPSNRLQAFRPTPRPF